VRVNPRGIQFAFRYTESIPPSGGEQGSVIVRFGWKADVRRVPKLGVMSIYCRLQSQPDGDRECLESSR
jgi:hypothetical protein